MTENVEQLKRKVRKLQRIILIQTLFVLFTTLIMLYNNLTDWDTNQTIYIIYKKPNKKDENI